MNRRAFLRSIAAFVATPLGLLGAKLTPAPQPPPVEVTRIRPEWVERLKREWASEKDERTRWHGYGKDTKAVTVVVEGQRRMVFVPPQE